MALGIDTSNYKTSVAVVDRMGSVIFDKRSFLEVKKGQRGLRQSEAFFQHVNKLPGFFSEIFLDDHIRKNIGCIAVSDRPRPVSGSYMPVFCAGVAFAQSLSASMDVPMFRFSHQEGHIEAVRSHSTIKKGNRFICFHFSGGTTEALLIDETGKLDIVGGSRDISYGQVLDRIGVAMGFDFPCGETIDKLALQARKPGEIHINVFSPVKVRDCYFNLSGIESQGQRLIRLGHEQHQVLAEDLMKRLSSSIMEMTLQLNEKYKIDDFIFAGGVSSSKYLREYIKEQLPTGLNAVFASSDLSSDNAVGTALLGGSKIWR